MQLPPSNLPAVSSATPPLLDVQLFPAARLCLAPEPSPEDLEAHSELELLLPVLVRHNAILRAPTCLALFQAGMADGAWRVPFEQDAYSLAHEAALQPQLMGVASSSASEPKRSKPNVSSPTDQLMALRKFIMQKVGVNVRGKQSKYLFPGLEAEIDGREGSANHERRRFFHADVDDGTFKTVCDLCALCCVYVDA